MLGDESHIQVAEDGGAGGVGDLMAELAALRASDFRYPILRSGFCLSVFISLFVSMAARRAFRRMGACGRCHLEKNFHLLAF
ncbi:hypothetical protein HED60_17415 [Planctomycetales bacterium ZRK34]|nr:hypothetical protein HED60_17415 [Planctomycetales bacterium ZRK34]